MRELVNCVEHYLELLTSQDDFYFTLYVHYCGGEVDPSMGN